MTSTSQKSYQMSFFIQFGRGFAEVKLNKKKLTLSIELCEYFDNILHNTDIDKI